MRVRGIWEDEDEQKSGRIGEGECESNNERREIGERKIGKGNEARRKGRGGWQDIKSMRGRYPMRVRG